LLPDFVRKIIVVDKEKEKRSNVSGVNKTFFAPITSYIKHKT